MLAQTADRFRQRVFGNHAATPADVQQCVLVHQNAGVAQKIGQQCLPAAIEFDLAPVHVQLRMRLIELHMGEPPACRRGATPPVDRLIHPPPVARTSLARQIGGQHKPTPREIAAIEKPEAVARPRPDIPVGTPPRECPQPPVLGSVRLYQLNPVPADTLLSPPENAPVSEMLTFGSKMR